MEKFCRIGKPTGVTVFVMNIFPLTYSLGNPRRFRAGIGIAAALACMGSTALAAQVRVDFHAERDLNSRFMSGVVDTAANTFVIDYWAGKVGGLDLISPVNQPLTLAAYSVGEGLSPFDIPDSWNGTVGSEGFGILWGFALSEPNSGITWSEPLSRELMNLLGFGFGAYYDNSGSGGPRISIDNPDPDLWMIYHLPDNTNDSLNIVSLFVISPIPEPSAALLSAASCGLLLMRRHRKGS